MLRLDRDLPNTTTHAGHLQLAATLFRGRTLHLIDALQPRLLFGAACLWPLA